MKSKWAFLVGIDDYKYLPPLKYAGKDADLLESKLVEICGFDKTRVISKRRHDVFPPTSAEIVGQLVDFIGSLQPTDTFLFYFAGHGCIIRDRTYLVGIDARRNQYVRRTGAIPLDDITEILASAPAEQTIVICDCCRYGLVEGVR